MTELPRISLGQRDKACVDHDKWTLLDTLTRAARAYGLNHRTLGVLRALLSFFPHRALPADPGAAVVFPSNRVLSLRLNGMPESTLRRHLSTLVRAGIVSRQDSANRKRFARFGGVAFGFDLSPLARAAEALEQAASAAEQERQAVATLRDHLAATRVLLRDVGLPEDHPAMEHARLLLRRKVCSDTLRAALKALEIHLDKSQTITVCPAGMSAPDSENERHIQSTKESLSVSKAASPTKIRSRLSIRPRRRRVLHL